MATTGSIHEEVLNTLAKAIREKLKVFDSHAGTAVGGSEKVAEILNLLKAKTGKDILSDLEKKDSSLASRIKDKMLTFADIVNIDDRSLKKVLFEVENEVIALALKDEKDEMKQKFFSNVSDNRKKVLFSELKTLGPQKRPDIQTAKNKVMESLKKLEDKGELFFKGDDKGDEWV